MQCIYYEISKNRYESLKDSDTGISEIFGRSEYIGKNERKDKYLVLDGTWDLVYYILQGKSLFEAGNEEPLIFGSNIISEFDADKDEVGPVRYITNEELRSCIDQLEGVDRDEYEKRFSFDDVVERKIYFDKESVQGNVMEQSLASFQDLKKFFERAYSNQSFLLVYFN